MLSDKIVCTIYCSFFSVCIVDIVVFIAAGLKLKVNEGTIFYYLFYRKTTST